MATDAEILAAARAVEAAQAHFSRACELEKEAHALHRRTEGERTEAWRKVEAARAALQLLLAGEPRAASR